MIREKRTVSGRMLELDYYPVWDDGRRIPTRAPKTRPSTPEQERYNRTMAVKRALRKINANMDESDYYMHPTYAPDCAPESEEEARRNIVNYLRRVRARRRTEAKRVSAELTDAERALAACPDSRVLASSVDKLRARKAKLEQPMKYGYRIEEIKYQRGPRAGKSNWHYHLIVSGGLPEREMEEMWTHGERVNCNRYQPERFGPEAAVQYMAKLGGRIVFSRNMVEPGQRTRDRAATERQVEKWAKERVEDRAYWERRHKGYKLLRCYARYNPYNGRWYVSVVMWRTKDGPPPRWDIDDWITSDGGG